MVDDAPHPKSWWCQRKSKRTRRERERLVETTKQIRRELKLPEHPHLT